jgi:trimethylamine:corrinoid methyltransferase-like protein
VERLRAALLSESERTFIRERTFWVLEHVGVSVPCARALDLLAEGGAGVDRENNLARIISGAEQELAAD